MAEVNSIDTAPKKNYTPVIAGTTVGALAGLGSNYFWGKQAPKLEEVFAQSPDVFETSMTTAKNSGIEGADEAVATLKEEMKAYNNAGDAKAVHKALKEKYAAVKDITLDQSVEANKTIEETLTQATADKNKAISDAVAGLKDENNNAKYADYKELKTKLNDKAKALKTANAAKEAAAKGSDEAAKTQANQLAETAKTEFEAVQKDFQSVRTTAKDKISNFNKAAKAKYDAQLAKFTEAASKDGNAKNLEAAVTTSKKALTDARSTKLTEILGKDSVIKAYDKIKGSLKEFNIKSGGLWALAGAGVGLIAGLILNSNKEA